MEAGNPQNKAAERSWINWALAASIVALLLTMFFLPRFLPHRHSSRLGCLANLKTIEGAKLAWMREHGKTTNDSPSEAEMYGRDKYITSPPICPGGGKYTLGKAGGSPRCSIPGHALE